MLEKCLGQSALEFLMIVAFITLVFISLFSIVNNHLGELKEGNVAVAAEGIAKLVTEQIILASTVSEGYSSHFTVPQIVNGQPYALQLIDGRELVVVYQGYEHVIFLPVNVTGNISFGDNKIGKKNGGVYLG